MPGTSHGRFILPTFFRLQFNVKDVSLATDNTERKNILQLVDVVSGVELLGVYVTEQLSLEYRYGGQVVLAYGPAIRSDYVTTMTNLIVTVSNSRLVVLSSDGSAQVETVLSSQIDTTGRVYQVYVSKPSPSYASSYGTTSSLSLIGKLP